MDAVNKTLYIPLYGKAYVSKKGVILNDKKAQEIWDSTDIKLSNKCKSKYLCYYMSMRSSVFDSFVEDKLRLHDDAVVLHIGCGLDSRNLRVKSDNHPWYDIDLPQVIAKRMQYYHQTLSYSMIQGDVCDKEWLDIIPHNKTAIVVLEGVSMYLQLHSINALFSRLSEHFEHLHILVDCYTEFAAKASKYKNPVNDIGVNKVYGVDNPELLVKNTDVTFVCEHSLTPDYLIKQLSFFERAIFKNIYAGKVSKQLYRLYEFKK